MKLKENYGGFKGIVKFIANVISWTALVVLILLALFLAYYTINTKLYNKKGEKFEPFVSLYTIVSPSMTPNINVYDVIITKKISSPNDIKVGDVITFTSTSSISKGMTVTHRVVEVLDTDKGIAYKTKGDNNLSPDSSPAYYNNVLGKVILRIPQLGRVQSFLAAKGGWLFLIVLPALIIIISDIVKIFKLVGVKNQIETINTKDKKAKEKQAELEEKRKLALKQRLQVNTCEKISDEKKEYKDLIITKKPTKVVVAGPSKINKMNKLDKEYPKKNKKAKKYYKKTL